MKFKRLLYVRAAGYLSMAALILVLLFVLFNTGGCDSKERVIKIGCQGVMTGEYKSFGEEQMISARLAASKLSPVRVGGFDYDIEVVVKDDEGNPEKAFLVAREMVDEGVAAAIGSTFDGTTEVSLPVYEEYNIPLISPFAQKTEVSKEGNLFFRMIINNEQKVENIANFIRDEINPQKILLINNREEYSINLVDYLWSMLTDYGIELAGTEPMAIEMEEEDAGIIAENLLIEGPDAIFFCGNYNEVADLMEKAGDAGLHSRFITETMGMDDNIFTLADAQYLEGLIAVIPDPPSLARYSQDSRAVSFWHDFKNYLEQTDGTDADIEGPGEYAPYCYDSVFIVIEAIKRANSVLPGDFTDELRAISYDGVAGHIEFDSNGDRLEPESTVFVVKDGAWVRY
ncbi:MAG: branched-chain amino acid ABC transporter substrate-binding protein [Actinomycetota bacterium]|nr:branched-chain amino acid ABC transporter substrate-binding protein [Actinomycetota bacterium]